MIHFNSSVTFKNGESTMWEGMICVLKGESPYETEVKARGSRFHMIFGKHAHGGNFLCVPNWNIGMEMVHPGDRFWNYERLQECGVGAVDASSMADALVQLSRSLDLKL